MTDVEQTHFGFAALFESDWYVHLQLEGDAPVNLAVLDGQHATIPEQARGRAAGVILNFEVEASPNTKSYISTQPPT